MLQDDYIAFISKCKTERECIEFVKRELDSCGYVPLTDKHDKNKRLFYMIKMNKALIAFKLGKQPISHGMNILCAHVDSPRLDIKQNPIFTNTGVAYLNTHYYGGIRKYQWLTLPLAIHGVVCKKNGETKSVVIGEKESDPVFCISDLLPHLAKEQVTKKVSEFVEGESLDVIIGNEPDMKDNKKYKEKILEVIKDKYQIEDKDFYSSELEIVPAGPARYMGLDKSMILGYGQDDRCCAFSALKAFVADNDTPEITQCLLLVDKEEIGSVGATGLNSHLLENAVSELVYNHYSENEYSLRKCLENSNILSCDVTSAYDSKYSDRFDMDNASFLGQGPVLSKFTGYGGKYEANDANPEYVAKIRSVLESKNIPYQVAELGKVDAGGGGTIALYAAKYGMNTIDMGISVMSMHSPWEIINAKDIEYTFQAYKEFLSLV